jgi:membrane protein required for colicin V production
MNILDIILGALILFGLIRGLSKGLFVEVASVIALIAGVFGAIHFSDFVSNFLESRFDWNERTINIIAFVITFFIIVLAISMAGKALTKLADFAALGMLNKLLGAIFGAIKIGLILSIVLMIFDKMNKTLPFIEEEEFQESILYNPIKSIAPTIFPYIIKEDLPSETANTEN